MGTEINSLTTGELLDLAVSTQDDQIRQAALVEHSRRIENDPTIAEIPAEATVAERVALIQQQLSSVSTAA